MLTPLETQPVSHSYSNRHKEGQNKTMSLPSATTELKLLTKEAQITFTRWVSQMSAATDALQGASAEFHFLLYHHHIGFSLVFHACISTLRLPLYYYFSPLVLNHSVCQCSCTWAAPVYSVFPCFMFFAHLTLHPSQPNPSRTSSSFICVFGRLWNVLLYVIF